MSYAPNLKEDMREACSKISAINIEMLLSGDVDLLALGAVDLAERREYLDTGGGELLAHPNREDNLSFAHYARAVSKDTEEVLLLHQAQTW